MKLLDALLLPVVALAGRLVPRRPHAWCFVIDDHQTFEGNPATLATYLHKQGNVEVTLLDCRKRNRSTLSLPEGVNVVRAGGWAELKLRLRCRQVVICHSLRPIEGRFSWLSDVRVINLWHGIPVKGMGNMDAGFPRRNLRKKFHNRAKLHTFCVSSELERSFMAACQYMDAERIRVTGIPRTDMLLQESKLTSPQRALIADIRAFKAGRKLMLYAPTFRDYQQGAIGLNREQLEQLDRKLSTCNVVLAIRPHPREAALFDALMTGLEHIVPADSRRWPDANALLSETDALITDYSSIWIEYLLLNRPVLAYWWDYQRYAESRGFLVDVPAVFPGPQCADFASLMTGIEQCIHQQFAIEPAYAMAYQNSRRLFHRHLDGKSCERIAEAVNAD